MPDRPTTLRELNALRDSGGSIGTFAPTQRRRRTLADLNAEQEPLSPQPIQQEPLAPVTNEEPPDGGVGRLVDLGSRAFRSLGEGIHNSLTDFTTDPTTIRPPPTAPLTPLPQTMSMEEEVGRLRAADAVLPPDGGSQVRDFGYKPPDGGISPVKRDASGQPVSMAPARPQVPTREQFAASLQDYTAPLTDMTVGENAPVQPKPDVPPIWLSTDQVQPSEEEFRQLQQRALDLVNESPTRNQGVSINDIKPEHRALFLDQVYRAAVSRGDRGGQNLPTKFAREVGRSLIDAKEGISRTAESIGDYVTGAPPRQTPEQAAFDRDVLNALEAGNNPTLGEPTAIKWALQAVPSATQMAAGLAMGGPLGGGRAAATALGKAAISGSQAAYWTTQIAPEEINKIYASGKVDKKTATRAGLLSAAIQGAIETIEVNPFRAGTGAGIRGLRNRVIDVAKTYGKEILTEEGLQAATSEIIRGSVTNELDAQKVVEETVKGVKDALGPGLFLVGSGGAVNVAQGVSETVGDIQDRRQARAIDERTQSLQALDATRPSANRTSSEEVRGAPLAPEAGPNETQFQPPPPAPPTGPGFDRNDQPPSRTRRADEAINKPLTASPLNRSQQGIADRIQRQPPIGGTRTLRMSVKDARAVGNHYIDLGYDVNAELTPSGRAVLTVSAEPVQPKPLQLPPAEPAPVEQPKVPAKQERQALETQLAALQQTLKVGGLRPREVAEVESQIAVIEGQLRKNSSKTAPTAEKPRRVIPQGQDVPVTPQPKKVPQPEVQKTAENYTSPQPNVSEPQQPAPQVKKTPKPLNKARATESIPKPKKAPRPPKPKSRSKAADSARRQLAAEYDQMVSRGDLADIDAIDAQINDESTNIETLTPAGVTFTADQAGEARQLREMLGGGVWANDRVRIVKEGERFAGTTGDEILHELAQRTDDPMGMLAESIRRQSGGDTANNRTKQVLDAVRAKPELMQRMDPQSVHAMRVLEALESGDKDVAKAARKVKPGEGDVLFQEQLKVGDEFEIAGDKYRVVQSSEDGTILKDGETLSLDPGEMIAVDSGTAILQNVTPDQVDEQTDEEEFDTSFDIAELEAQTAAEEAAQEGQPREGHSTGLFGQDVIEDLPVGKQGTLLDAEGNDLAAEADAKPEPTKDVEGQATFEDVTTERVGESLPSDRGAGTELPARTADTMSDAIALASPSGRMSKRQKDKATKALSEKLFGPGGLTREKMTGKSKPPTNAERAANLRRIAKLASKSQSKKLLAEADQIEKNDIGTAEPATPSQSEPEGSQQSVEKQPWELTARDLVSVKPRRFPRSSYRGELHDANGSHIGNVYVISGEVYIGEPKPFGRGEVNKMLPGTFAPKAFKRDGGITVTGGYRVKFWRFKTPKDANEIKSVDRQKSTGTHEQQPTREVAPTIPDDPTLLYQSDGPNAPQGKVRIDEKLPFNADNIAKVFRIPKSQAAAIEAVAKAMDIDTNRVELRKGRRTGKRLILGGKAKGAVDINREGNAVIWATGAADISTGLHELAHVARRTILNRDIAPNNRPGITDEHITIAEQWAGAEGGQWTREAEERFARGFERYMRDGSAPTKQLKGLFDTIRKWLGSIYRRIKGSNIDIGISPEMRKVYDALVSRGDPGITIETSAAKKARQRAQAAQKLRDDVRNQRKIEEDIRNQVVQQAKEVLPVDQRGKVITQVRDARTPATLRKGMERIAQVAADAEKTQALNELAKAMKDAKAAKLRPEYQAVVDNLTEELSLRKITEKTRRALRATAEYLENNENAIIPPAVIERLKLLNQTAAAELTADEIRDVAKSVNFAIAVSKLKNQLIASKRARTQEELAERILTQMDQRVGKMKERSPRLTRRLFNKLLNRQTLSEGPKRSLSSMLLLEAGTRPEVLMEHLSPDLRDLIWEDIGVQAHHVEEKTKWEFRDALEKAVNAAAPNRMFTNSFENWRHEELKLQARNGQRVTITRDEAIWIYTVMRDPSNREILQRTGITLDRTDADYKIDPEAVDELIGPAERAISDHMFQQFNGDMKRILNTPFVDVYGFEIATNENYVPRNIDMYRAETKVDPLIVLARSVESSLTSWGHLKQRVGANAPLRIRGALDVYMDHVDHVSRIAAYLAPVTNAHAILGRSDVKQAIIERGGKVMLNRILGAIQMQTVRQGDDGGGWGVVRQATSLAGAGILGLRISPMLKNPSGLFIAASYQGGGKLLKSALDGFNPAEWKRVRALARKHSPYWRTRYDNFANQSTSGVASIQRGFGRKSLPEMSLIPLELSDQFGAVIRWNMSEMYVEEQGTPRDAPDFNEKVAREWERSMFRSENTGHGMEMTGAIASGRRHAAAAPWFMFSSSTSKIFSAAVRSALAASRGEKALALTAASGFLGAITWAAMAGAGLARARGGDDEDESFVSDVAKRSAQDTAKMVPIVGSLALEPIVRKVLKNNPGTFSGNLWIDQAQAAGRGASDMYAAVENWMEGKTPGRRQTSNGDRFLRGLDRFVETTSPLAGIPYGGARDLTRITMNLVTQAASKDVVLKEVKKLRKKKKERKEWIEARVKQRSRQIPNVTGYQLDGIAKEVAKTVPPEMELTDEEKLWLKLFEKEDGDINDLFKAADYQGNGAIKAAQEYEANFWERAEQAIPKPLKKAG